jgi:hypothetical protein
MLRRDEKPKIRPQPSLRSLQSSKSSATRIFLLAIALISVAFVIIYVFNKVNTSESEELDPAASTNEEKVADHINSGSSSPFYEFNPKFEDFKIIQTKTFPSFQLLDVPASENNPIHESLTKNGIYEPHITQLIRALAYNRACDNERVFVDIGAGIGYYSNYAGVLHCDVISFQPKGLYYQMLFSSSAKNKLRRAKFDVYGDQKPVLNNLYGRTQQAGCEGDDQLCFKHEDAIIILRIDEPNIDNVIFILENADILLNEGVVRNIIIKVHQKGQPLRKVLKLLEKFNFDIKAINEKEKGWGSVQLNDDNFELAVADKLTPFDHLWCSSTRQAL